MKHKDDNEIIPPSPQKKGKITYKYNYRITPSTGKKWRRKEVRKKIACPVCSKATVWVSRHLRTRHAMSHIEANKLLESLDSFRRRNGSQPKVKCPVESCNLCVVRLNEHLMRVHKTSRAALNIGRKTREQKTVASTILPIPANEAAHVNLGFVTNLNINDIHLDTVVDVQMAVSEDEEQEMKSVFDVPAILASFEIYMGDPDGGGKAKPSSYVHKARHVINTIGDIKKLTRDSVKTMFFMPQLRAAESGTGNSFRTVRGKLKALQYFMEFLKDQSKHISGVDGQMLQNVDELINALPNWRSSMKNKCTLELVKKRVIDSQEELTSSDLITYKTCEYAILANQCLLSFESAQPVTPYDFNRARNHLLTILSTSTAHRAGVLANFKVLDYSEGLKESAKDGLSSMVFTVAEHKTAGSHGAATFAVDEEELRLMKGYFSMRNSYLASRLGGRDIAYFFINNTGTRMSQSNIGCALTAAFLQSGYNYRVNCTKVRHAAVTNVHRQHPERAQDLAAHMLHTLGTAEKYYRHTKKKDNSVSMTTLIRQTLSKPGQVGGQLPATSTETNHLNAEAEIDTDNIAQNESPNDTHNDADNENGVEKSNIEPLFPYQHKNKWSIENRDLVRDYFSEMIQREKTPIAEVRLALDANDQLRLKLEKDFKTGGSALVHIVKDKIRSFFRSKYGDKRWNKK